ncbi:3-methylcrotonyl-CoA carboxylase [Alkanindiges hydrocarboniclasticus]|uniref:Biotin carboxylase n=1 Tax=Alkanindiges hydrocarboniclasticus TaxID=1907941 RepID=A0A1S8CYA8_9GAMM|nr:acetyl/propionyl/methylcrotonyl-CoA carboxylase subunit alpha [Alkanindiges hydrocarboniclasticus]ONG41625.1 3-methylcrotonyl-CoA carboxylase [Alkanindiges hydrocarboniclasticus]
MAFSKVLVANRGEIAVRVMRTAKALGYQTVAVYSKADAKALHVQYADEAVCIGESKVSESYLKIENILNAAKLTGADAIHPGYGFLSENSGFAQACQQAGICFIGPTPDAIELMGSKRLSKIAMIEAGVPCIPGYEGGEQSLEHLTEQGQKIGFPLMVKASAGGGGRGMRLVETADDLPAALATARSEAENAFGSGELILERAVIAPRHVEVQVFGDTHGNVVYLFERDCSIQRRHQKVVEEAPCPVMTDDLRQRMGEAAVAAAKSCNYVGAGTVEFLLDSNGNFYFLEMNTRLQVEHPVTELITGLDLVEWQLRVANGEPLPLQQDQLQLNGHAIEVRLYAEDPSQQFLPQTGSVLLWQPASLPNVRIDHGMTPQGEVSPFYDPMIAKIIAYGKTREDAVRLLARAVEDSVLLGVNSNKQFLVNLLRHPELVAGNTSTAFIAQHFSDDVSLHPVNADFESLAITAALYASSDDENNQVWQSALDLPRVIKLQMGEQTYTIQILAKNDGLHVSWNEQQATLQILHQQENLLTYIWQGVRRNVAFVQQQDTLYLDRANGNLTIQHTTYAPPASANTAGDGQIRAPMDGAIVNVLVNAGDTVTKGQTLLILEAMKIQQQIKADVDGIVAEIIGQIGQQVKKRQVLLKIEVNQA